MKNRFILATVLGVALMTHGVVSAHRSGVDDHGPRKHMRQVFQQLDLELAQKVAIRSVMTEARDNFAIYRDDMDKLREEMAALVSSGNLSEESVAALLMQHQTTLEAMVLAKADKKYAVYQILTAAQRDQARALMAELHARLQNRDGETRFARMAEKLALTEQQIAAIEPLMDDVKVSRQALHGVLVDFRETLRSLFEQGAYSSTTMSEAFRQHFPEFQSAVYDVIASHQQIFLLLDSEQQEQIKAHKSRGFVGHII